MTGIMDRFIKQIPTPEGVPVTGVLRSDGSYDIGEHCTHCGCDVSWGSGLYVNRIPSGHRDDKDSPEIVGFMCADCQTMTCETCDEPTLEWSMRPEGGVVCDECAGKEGLFDE